MERILARLDEHLHKNDYAAAERHLLYWLEEKKDVPAVALPLYNELMGLYRKLSRHDEAIHAAETALSLVKENGIEEHPTAATTYLNAATVLHAAKKTEKSIPLFEKARAIYERELSPYDTRLGGLYNNMALALVALSRFAEANELYLRAIAVMENAEDGGTEIAITYLNMADAAVAEHGLTEAEAAVTDLLEKAKELLEEHPKKDGHYAFVCEKCASVFGYYGHFRYEKELSERARRIYEGA
ncbi:MAG: tetratricopeptide repeat protein [Ruminococcaceae bacterium]|nr:tetratricopeptide repeat protein [Oscillospiraceae bacterium]